MAARIVGLAAQARLVTAALSARLVGPRGLLLQGLRAVRGARRGLGDCSHIMRVRTGMACVLCWSFSLVGAGSSARAWPLCWLIYFHCNVGEKVRLLQLALGCRLATEGTINRGGGMVKVGFRRSRVVLKRALDLIFGFTKGHLPRGHRAARSPGHSAARAPSYLSKPWSRSMPRCSRIRPRLRWRCIPYRQRKGKPHLSSRSLAESPPCPTAPRTHPPPVFPRVRVPDNLAATPPYTKPTPPTITIAPPQELSTTGHTSPSRWSPKNQRIVRAAPGVTIRHRLSTRLAASDTKQPCCPQVHFSELMEL